MINSSLIESKFLRSKRKFNFTKLWREGNESIRSSILDKIVFDTGEFPIIYYFKDDSLWWVLSNGSIHVKTQSVQKLRFKDVKRIGIDPLLSGDINKKEIESVQVYTNHGAYNLPVEKFSWPIIFEILQFVVKKMIN